MFRSGRNSKNMPGQFDAPKHRRFSLVLVLRLILGILLCIIILGGVTSWKKFLKAKNAATVGLIDAVSNRVNKFVDNNIIGQEGEVTTETKINLKDVLDIEQLSTLDYNYSGICPLVGENGKIVYYIAYDGIIHYGIDLSKMKDPVVDDDKKTITITIPDVEMQGNPEILVKSLDYLFIDESANIPQTAATAQEFCETAILDAARNDEKLLQNARDNTYSEFVALNKPLINIFFPDYELIVEWDV